MTRTLPTLCLAALGLLPALPGLAQNVIVAPTALEEGFEGTAPAIQAQSWVVTPSVDDQGQPVLDENGVQVTTLVPMDEASAVPGSTVVYEFAITNPTDAAVNNAVLQSEFPSLLALDPVSFTGPEGINVAFATQDEPDTWHQIHPVLPEAEREGMPSLDAMTNLRVIVPEVPADSQALVSYAAVIRQGATTTLTETPVDNSETR